MLKVAQAAVNKFRRRRGGVLRQIIAFAQQYRQSATCQIARDPGAVDAATCDQHVNVVRGRSIVRCAGCARQCSRGGRWKAEMRRQHRGADAKRSHSRVVL